MTPLKRVRRAALEWDDKMFFGLIRCHPRSSIPQTPDGKFKTLSLDYHEM